MQADSGKLFIGGISWDTNEERLKEYFSTFGEVLEAVIMKDRSTGRARGFGFVVFSDPAVAEQVTKEKHNIDGRMVEAKKAVPRDDQSNISRSSSNINGSPSQGSTRKIFVGGLPPSVTESSFKKYFEQYGTITDAVVMYDQNTQRPRGFGFITYDNEEAVNEVLLKSFHELNGKMVEVKRAVPKELSPGPTSSPVGRFKNSLSRASSFPNGCTTNIVGGYGIGMEGSFSPVAGGRSGFPSYDSLYGAGIGIDPGLKPTYEGSMDLNSGLNHGRGLSPFLFDNLNRLGNPITYDGENGGNSSFFSSPATHVCGNQGLNHSTNFINSNAYSGRRHMGERAFGNSKVNWNSLATPLQGTGHTNNGILSYGVGNTTYGLGTGGLGSNGERNVSPAPLYRALNGIYNGGFSESYGGNSIHSDHIWPSSIPDRDGSGLFAFGLDIVAPDVSARSSPRYAGGYTVDSRQSRGIAA